MYKIVIVNTLPIPSGQASVNRILSLGKGLVEIGDKVSILSTAKGDDSHWHEKNGMKFRNLRGDKSLLRSLWSLMSYVSCNKKDIDFVWLVSNSPLLILPLWMVCKIKGITFVQEKSEFPFVLMKKGIFAKAWAWLYVNTIYKLFDGMIIMTQPLMDYFRPLVKKNCKLIKVPMTVDMSRFEGAFEKNPYGDYAAYCGDMSGNKDGVVNLIEAFSYVERLHPDFKLVLIGGAKSNAEFENIKQKVKDLKLKNVIFTGKVTRDEIPSILKNAKILCLARPSSLQSAGGFPTKLGEYLSTGNPVVVTAVGEIPSYLNESNSFIVEPDNNDKFGKNMNDVLNDYEKACIRGREGRNVALSNFNYKVQAERLHQYFENF